MNAEKFSRAMGEINEKYVEEAVCYQKRAANPLWLKWGSLAACFGLVIVSAFSVSRFAGASGVGLLREAPDSSLSQLSRSSGTSGPAVSGGPALEGAEPGGYEVSQSALSSSGAASAVDPLPESAEGENTFTEDTDRLMPQNVIIDETMTWEEARALEPFGAYMPLAVPSGFYGESFRRFQNDTDDFLSGLWTNPGSFDEISWRVCFYDESMESRMTSAEDTPNYDLSLYPFPLADSVPDELSQIVYHPIFDIDELTREVVSRRAYTISELGDTTGFRMSFAVRYGDIVVELSAKGVSPEWAYEQLTALEKTDGK